MFSKIKHIASGADVEVRLPASEDPVEYPSEFFSKLQQKPKLYVADGHTVEQLRQFVEQGLISRNVNIVHINSYLYHVLKDTEALCDRDWTSFGINIGKAGSKVKIFDMLDVEYLENKPNAGQACPEACKDDDVWLPMYLLGLYRVGRATVPSYQNDLMEALNTQCKFRSPKFRELVQAQSDFYEAWSNDLNFTRIVAAVDMFFHRFKKHSDAGLRFGTIVSRFRDCASLSTFHHLVKITGLSLADVGSWILNDQVAREIIQMMRPGQEIDHADSYMPYLIDMGLSTKSPYSSVKNPCFHFWGQMTALLLRSSRAKHARVPDDIPYPSITNAALLFAYAVGRTSDIAQRFTTGDVYESSKKGGASKLLSVASVAEPETSEVIKWLAWWDDKGKSPTKEMESFARRAVHALTDLRANSIGKYAKTHFDQ
ncbi:nucleocapsid protein [Vesiculovirus bogdanovac]|uniref:Nucleoprotein n=1 Tax=Vesiculovirus bogdanovac TaxID=1972567 RepID=K4FL64_9RHAB|nr:nucleocapsid protein [Vesiculovirus bogdanovac]AFH89676.1 nucleocapsid protein [Vesiculovirus bogdanovac]